MFKSEFFFLNYFEYAVFNGDVCFFSFDRKYPFPVNLVQKIKTVSVSWNLVPTLIPICRILWWYLFFFCFQSEMVFWANLVQKFKIIERETWYLNGNQNKTFQEEYAQIYFIHFITKNFRYHSINFTIINYFTSWCLHFQSSCKSTRQWEIYSKLTKTREQLHWNHSCDFGFNVRQNGCSQIFDQNNWH